MKFQKINKELVQKDFSIYNDFSFIDSLQRNDIDFYLANDILVKVDRSSMANSLGSKITFSES